MVKSGLEFFILKFGEPLQRYLLLNLAGQFSLSGQIFFCTGQQQSRPFFTIIFKLKNGNFKTRDFSPLIERVLAGVFLFSLFWKR